MHQKVKSSSTATAVPEVVNQMMKGRDAQVSFSDSSHDGVSCHMCSNTDMQGEFTLISENSDVEQQPKTVQEDTSVDKGVTSQPGPVMSLYRNFETILDTVTAEIRSRPVKEMRKSECHLDLVVLESDNLSSQKIEVGTLFDNISTSEIDQLSVATSVLAANKLVLDSATSCLLDNPESGKQNVCSGPTYSNDFSNLWGFMVRLDSCQSAAGQPNCEQKSEVLNRFKCLAQSPGSDKTDAKEEQSFTENSLGNPSTNETLECHFQSRRKLDFSTGNDSIEIYSGSCSPKLRLTWSEESLCSRFVETDLGNATLLSASDLIVGKLEGKSAAGGGHSLNVLDGKGGVATCPAFDLKSKTEMTSENGGLSHVKSKLKLPKFVKKAFPFWDKHTRKHRHPSFATRSETTTTISDTCGELCSSSLEINSGSLDESLTASVRKKGSKNFTKFLQRRDKHESKDHQTKAKKGTEILKTSSVHDSFMNFGTDELAAVNSVAYSVKSLVTSREAINIFDAVHENRSGDQQKNNGLQLTVRNSVQNSLPREASSTHRSMQPSPRSVTVTPAPGVIKIMQSGDTFKTPHSKKHKFRLLRGNKVTPIECRHKSKI